MKITELAQQTDTVFNEGILSTLIDKVKSAIGGEVTHFSNIAALLQNNNEFPKIVDAVITNSVALISKKYGATLNQMMQTQQYPAADIFNVIVRGGLQAANNGDNAPTSLNDILNMVRTKHADIIKMADNNQRSHNMGRIVHAFVSGAANITRLDITEIIQVGSLLVAGAIVLIQIAEQDATDNFTNITDKFEDASKALEGELFDNTRLQLLSPNHNLKKNLMTLILHGIVSNVYNSIKSKTAAQVTALAAAPIPFLARIKISETLLKHLTVPAKPGKPVAPISAETQELANDIEDKSMPLLEEQIKEWYALVVYELNSTNSTTNSRGEYNQWVMGVVRNSITPLDESAESDLTENLLVEDFKARIDHPEDLVYDEGATGAIRALQAMVHAAKTPASTTVKWDGAPAIIFGRDEDGFMFTDKAGFASKAFDKVGRDATAVQQMIHMRKPNAPGRLEYSHRFASLHAMLEKITPKQFRGYIQADVMWFTTPAVENGVISFSPVKVKYTIDAASDLGAHILHSTAGIVVHSMYSAKTDSQPRAIASVAQLGLGYNPKLVVLDPEMTISKDGYSLPTADVEHVAKLIKDHGTSVNNLLDSAAIAALKISNLSELFKSYTNFTASQGSRELNGVKFAQWLQAPTTGLTTSKISNVLAHLAVNEAGVIAMWEIVNELVGLKYMLKKQFDKRTRTDVTATIRDEPGHEGFVSDTPHGKIKFVDRPVFMRKT